LPASAFAALFLHPPDWKLITSVQPFLVGLSLLQNGRYMMAATEYIKTMKLVLQSAKYSDLTLVCRGREFPVHRAIVCHHSPFWMRLVVAVSRQV
jgi:hypothetical protein